MYSEITLYPKLSCTSELCELLDELAIPYAVDDPAEIEQLLEETRQHWDYFDEALTVQRPATVKIYLPEATAAGELEQLRARSEHLLERMEQQSVSEADWADAWKPFWQATTIGENIVIVPEWKTVLRLDPGMLFGTGDHATTALCLEAAERLFKTRRIERVLDLGCGSGILSIAALLLGAKSATGYDVDVNMPKVANANAALNGVAPAFEVRDVLNADLGNGYDLVFANIVADVIIRLAPRIKSLLTISGSFVCSGVIAGRSVEVEDALKDAGLSITSKLLRDDWICYICELG